MKTTIKEYEAKKEESRDLYRKIDNFKDGGLASEYDALKSAYDEVQAYFASVEKVNVSFMIGYRSYYREVSVIGKTMFDGYTKMTKGNGYRCVKVIESITDKMKDEMISDSHYY